MAKKAYISVPTVQYINPLGEVAVGSTVKINENGTPVDYIVIHQGLPSSLYDTSCDGTWVLRKDIYEKRQWHSTTSVGYESSIIHSYLNSTLIDVFDSKLKEAIKQVKIPYCTVSGSSVKVNSATNGLSTKVFLLSGYEVGWTTSTESWASNLPIDGACLSYFEGTVATDSKRIAYLNGAETFWWLRSICTEYTDSPWAVFNSGYLDYLSSATNDTMGVRPAFILPSNCAVNDGVVTGAQAEAVYGDGIARKIKKGYLGIENFTTRALPEEYTQIEYVESTGAQYIDTGIMPNTNTSISIDFKMESSAVSQFVYGCRTSSYTNNFILLISNANSSFRSGFGSELLSFSISELTNRYKTFHNKEKCQIGTNELAHSGVDFTSTLSMYLFSANEGGTAKHFSSMKLYACKIYDGENLVRDYVPCTNAGGTAGLYDLVNNTFEESDSTTALIAGDTYKGIARQIKKAYISIGGGTKYKEVEYIESSGTQYIDTGFKPNNNTRVVMDAVYPTEPSTSSALFGARGTSASDKSFVIVRSINGYFRSDYNGTYTQQWEVDAITRRIYDKNKETTTIDGVSNSYTNATFQTPNNLYLFASNNGGVASWLSNLKVYSCQIYDNDVLIRDYVPVIDSNNNAGLFDKVSKYFIANAGSGSFTAGAETGNTYISNGIARPCWSGGELAYYGTITALSEARYHLAATTIGKFALFAGGRSSISSSTGSKTVDAYDSSLIRTSPSVLGQGVSQSSATTVGNYAVFAGGRTSAGATQSVQVYDTDLVHTVPTYWLSTARYSHAAASVGNYAVFGGGYYQAPINTVEAYDSSLTKKIATELSYQVMELSATTVGNYAIFAGGRYNSTARAEVDSYDSALTKRALTGLGYAKYNLAATTIGNYALFAGGQSSSTASTTRVDVYDGSLTKLADVYYLGVAKYTHAATTVGDYAIFAGGYVRNSSNVVATVEIFDKSLTRQDFTSLSQARQHFAATTVGDYALFGGGYGESSVISSVVDAFTVA